MAKTTRPAPRYVTRAEAATYASCAISTIDKLLADKSSNVNRYEILREPRVDLNELDTHMSRNLWSKP